ncbi:MAG: SIS domain-containing protein [Erysipelotrichaceae bacterium]
MKFEYTKKIISLLEEVEEKNSDALEVAIDKFVETIKNDKIIHAFGTGHSHMVGIELFARAGGLANVNAMIDADTITAMGAQRSCALEKLSGIADIIYDNYKINQGDIMIITSNSGRNAVPIEMALRCQKEGIYVIAITNISQSLSQESRHSSGKRLLECADLVIDTLVPSGDAMINVGNIKTGPASNLVGFSIVNTITSEAIKRCKEEDIKVMVFQSQNVDGYNNDDIYHKYDGRIKHY